MRTHDQLVKKLMRRPGVRAEVERIEREEFSLFLMPCSKRGKKRDLPRGRSRHEWARMRLRWLAWSEHWQADHILHQLQHCANTSRVA